LANQPVLDASAILAVLFNERGSEALVPLLEGALVSTVNMAEVVAQLVRRGVDAERAWRQVLELGCELCPFDEEQARLAGELARQARHNGLSLGSRACLALAKAKQATVYTPNPAWKSLDLGIEVEVVR
jgi:ribonuclease VapC